MEQGRDLTTANARIRWAIEKVRSQGVVLEKLAEMVGCSHAALSQWQTGATNMDNVKVGLLTNFCKATGVSLHWLLTGEGPRTDWYPTSDRVAELSHKLGVMEKTDARALSILAVMIEAAADAATPAED